MERLDKFLSAQTTLSRRDATAAVRRGRVTVDGAVVRDPAVKIDPQTAAVTLNGQALTYHRYIYIMMNKPAGILCVSRDPKAQTVVDLLPEEWRARDLFPAGRLDKDTTGMVLLTDDGELAHKLLSPRRHVAKRYRFCVKFPLTAAECERFRAGLVLEDGYETKPADIELFDDMHSGIITLVEGKYHQRK